VEKQINKTKIKEVMENGMPGEERWDKMWGATLEVSQVFECWVYGKGMHKSGFFRW